MNTLPQVPALRPDGPPRDAITVTDAPGEGMGCLTVWDRHGKPALVSTLPRKHITDEMLARTWAFVQGWEAEIPLHAGPQLVRD